MKFTLMIAAAMALCVAIAPAQGGQGQRQGGRAGFGMMGQGRGAGVGGELQLAFRKDVQTDLGLSADQKTKLDALQAKQRELRGQGQGQRRNRGQAGAGNTGNTGGSGANGGRANRGGQQMTDAEREAMRKRMQEQREQSRKDLAAILNDSQMKRLGEIRVQLMGARAVQQEETQKALNLTTAQITRISDLQEKQREANQALMQKVRNQELSREDVTKSIENNNKVLDAELLKVLTPEQSAKLKEMGGKPFKADPPQGRGGR